MTTPFPTRWFILVAALLVWAVTPLRGADEPLLKDLHKSHPRIFIHAEDVATLKQAIATDPLLKQWHERILARGVRMLTEKPVEHVLIGPRLLDKSRTVLGRVSTLAGLYLLDGDKRFADRARLEMLTVAAFADWNPSHFLDVGEMTNALGIGYDWLYDYLTPQDRNTIRNAIVNLGLKPGMEAFDKKAFWTRATHNWSQVCNGGLTVGMLAIGDEEPQLAEALLARTRPAFKPSMGAFAPDGGFAEGPGYWGYATIYNIYYLAALQSALNTDWGLKQMPGFPETGFYRIHSVGPVNKTFNYADAGEGAGSAPQMLWLASAFNQPAFAAHELSLVGNNASIFHLLWYKQSLAGKPLNAPLDAIYRGVNVAFFRSAWSDPKALYVGIKGGDNKANHSHLDLGSFVLDSQGYRWAYDLGGDDYNLPGYFGNKRWTYYRLRNESHNTLTIDGQNQSPKAVAPITVFSSTPQRSQVVIDLTDGYRTSATKVTRGLAMIDRRQILIQDEIEAPKDVEIMWSFVTPATIDTDGRNALLKQGDATLSVRILEPANARIRVISANPPKPQKQQPKMNNLTIQLTEKTRSARIVVLITPGQPQTSSPKTQPLSQWQ